MEYTLHDFNPETASNGAQGLEKMKTNYYFIILLDVIMPLMDGIECLKRLRKWEKDFNRKRQFIVILSANHIEENLDYDLQLQKPVSYKTLINTVTNRFKSYTEQS